MGSEFLACPKELRFQTVRSCYEQQAEMARPEGLSYERYLEEVLEHERQERQRRRIERLLRESAELRSQPGCRQLTSIRKMTYCN